MAEQPTQLPQWATTAGNTVEPSAGEKAAGYQVSTKPAARKMNWLLNLIYEWLQYVQTPVGTGAGAGVDATGGSTSGSGLKGTGGAPNGIGVEGIGAGTGVGVEGKGDSAADADIAGNKDGVYGEGGDSNSTGVTGKGGPTNGKGVYGEGTGTGTGVHGKSTNGHGLVAESDTTTPAKSALLITPQDAEPSSPEQGDVLAHATTGGLRIYDGSNWRKVLCNLAHLQSSSAVVSTAAETAFDISYTLPAGILTVGDSLRLSCTVFITNQAGGGGLDIYVRADGTSGGVLAQRSLAAPAIGRVSFVVNMVVVSIGAGGTVRAVTAGSDGVSGAKNVFDDNKLPTVDTTGTNNLVVTADWAVSSANNSCYLLDYVLDIAG